MPEEAAITVLMSCLNFVHLNTAKVTAAQNIEATFYSFDLDVTSSFRVLLGDKMKNWMTIGQFSKETGLSARALRVYEEMGLIKAHLRGENKYRYFSIEQIDLVKRIKDFKDLGFALAEIRSLLEIDLEMDIQKLEKSLQEKLRDIKKEQSRVNSQVTQIENVLSSLKNKKTELNPDERRIIMKQLEKLSVVVAGLHNLEKTAEYIAHHLEINGKKIPVILWDGQSTLPTTKPSILVIEEKDLEKKQIEHLCPDIVVIKEVSHSSPQLRESYLQLFRHAGPHMTTIFNADDRAAIELAGSEDIKKGRIFYFTKNSGLQPQIKNIGGVIGDGESIEVYGFNMQKEPLTLKQNRIRGLGEESALLASVAAVMELGLAPDFLRLD